MLQISNYKKYYNGILALDIPQLGFKEGIHWIKGKNGSGKTTLFKTLAGLAPFEGEIILNKQIHLRTHPLPYRMLVNYGEAEPVYPPFLTARDLIRFVAKTKKAPEQQLDRLMAAFGIENYMYTPCGTYSSGMLKKLSLIMAFLGQPSLIILDEPLTTIDDEAAGKVYEIIQHYRQTLNTTFLLSSHQQFDFSELAVTSTFQVANKTVVELT